jgi:hypothetical protein
LTPGSALARSWKRCSAARRLPVVIGPGARKSTSNGAAQPAPRSRSNASKLRRAASWGGRFATLGGPVSSATAGAARRINGNSVKNAATPGLRSARSAIRIHGLVSAAGPNCQRSMLVPSTASPAGIASSATSTAITVATIRPIVEETSSAPGAIASAHSIPSDSAVPANRTVRPARATTSSIASGTLSPFASSSRKRETISSE